MKTSKIVIRPKMNLEPEFHEAVMFNGLECTNGLFQDIYIFLESLLCMCVFVHTFQKSQLHGIMTQDLIWDNLTTF